MPSNIVDGRPEGPGIDSVLRNGLYNISGQTLRALIAVLTIPLLIRFLGLREYGVWSLVYAVLASMTLGYGGLGIASAVFLSKDLAEGKHDEAGETLTFVLGSAILLGVALGLILWFLGPVIVSPLAAFGSAERAEARSALQMACFGLPLLILLGTFVGVEQACDRYAAVNTFQTLQAALGNGGLVVVAWSGGRAAALMKWQVVAYSALLIAHSWFVFHLLRGRVLRFQWKASKAARIFRFGLATCGSMIGQDAFRQWSRWIVGALLGAQPLGVYAAITDLTGRVNTFAGTAVQPLAPSLSHGAAKKIPIEALIRQAAHLNALIAVEAGIFVYLLADVVMRVLVPAATSPQDIRALQVAAVIYALYSLNAPSYFVLFSTREARTNATVVLSSAILSLGLISLGAWRFGLLGAVAGNAGNLGNLLMVLFAMRKVGLTVRHYAAWIAFPLLGMGAALLAGAVLENHFWGRVTFVAIQAWFLLSWFSDQQGGVARLKVGWARFARGWGAGGE